MLNPDQMLALLCFRKYLSVGPESRRAEGASLFLGGRAAPCFFQLTPGFIFAGGWLAFPG